MATAWRDSGSEDMATDDWDLEDALARAILGDVGDLCVVHSSPSSTRDEAEEERLIERLHARLFRAKTTPDKGKKATVHPREVRPKAYQHVVKKPATRKAPPQVCEPSPSPSPSSRRSISPEKIDQMLTRFRLNEAKRSRKMATLQKEASVSSMGSVVSSDLVSPGSRKLTRGLPSFRERQALTLAARERERERHQQRQEQQDRDLGEALVEAIRTPCLCGAGVGKHDHSPACARFISACKKVNASSDIQRKTQRMRRTVDDLMESQERTKRKQTQMTEIQRRIEAQETTFAPQLNPNSIKIYEAMVESGRLEPDRLLKSPRPRPPPLGVKSKVVLTATRRRSSTGSRTSAKSQGSTWTGRRRSSQSVLPKAASFSESHYARHAAATTHKDSPPSPPHSPPFVVPSTTVTYDAATCDFILANFNQKAWFH